MSYLVSCAEFILYLSVGALCAIKRSHTLTNEVSVTGRGRSRDGNNFFQLQFESAGGHWRRANRQMETQPQAPRQQMILVKEREQREFCLTSRGKEEWKRERLQSGTTNGGLKKTRNKTLHSCQCENPHPA